MTVRIEGQNRSHDIRWRIAAWASRVKHLAGWRRYGAAALVGVLSILAMAPFHLWPVLFITLPALVWLIDGAVGSAGATNTPHEAGTAATHKGRLRTALRSPVGRAALVGWWFGFGYHFAGLFWIGEAFLVEAEIFAVLLPFAVTLLPAGLALFFAAATGLAARLWRPGMDRLVLLAVTVSIAEWLRGHILSGFPWNVLGYALTYPLPLMQTAAVLGIYALTLLTVLLLAWPGVALAGAAATSADPHARADDAHSLGSALMPIVLVAAMAMLGGLRLWPADAAASGTPLNVRIVQPSVPQREKWQPQNQERIFKQHLALSLTNAQGEADGGKGVALIVWPEAAMPFLPLNTPVALAEIGRTIPEGAHLITGALRLEEPERGRRLVYNSLLAFGAGGTHAGTYDKIHLVPFGEYLPLQSGLEAIGLQQLVRLRGGFASGAKPRPLLSLPGLPKLGPLVCYEAIFPGAIVQGNERPAALINVTNDGWFGNTTGPRQHLHQARVRAVEEGLPILRAANNGISAIIDGRGRVAQRIELNAIGVIDGQLPPMLAPPPYARFGDLGFLLMLAAAITWIFRPRESPN